MAERASEVTELKRNLAQALRDKEQLQEVKQQLFDIFDKLMANKVIYFFHFFVWFFFRKNTWFKTT